MAYSARSLSTNLLQQVVTEVAHGFAIGQVVGFDGTNWFLCQADGPTDAETIGMVSYIVDTDNFLLTQAGYVSQLSSPVVAGDVYYLSTTVPGGLQNTVPVTPGEVIVKLFTADTTSSGYYFNNAGVDV